MEIYNGTYCVYIHTNKINGKKYIGQTINGEAPNKRWLNGKGYINCTYFYKAIQKYGWDNFEHEVIASNLTQEEANHFEELLIEKFETINPDKGYNLKSGGENNKLSEATKRKIGDSNKGKIISDEQKKRISEAQTGRHLTQEHKTIIANANKGKILSNETKLKIGQSAIGRNIGRKHSKEELEKMRQKRKPHDKSGDTSNYKGRAVGSKTKKENPAYHKKMVMQFEMDGKLIAAYESVMEASRQTGINDGNISRCCNGHTRTAGGYIWLFCN